VEFVRRQAGEIPGVRPGFTPGAATWVDEHGLPEVVTGANGGYDLASMGDLKLQTQIAQKL
jgi:hypothetical protein